MKQVFYFGKLLTNNHFNDSKIIYMKEKWLKVTRVKGSCDEPDVDGDEGPSFPLEVKCIEKGIKMFL
jgi:diacylglycerol kinase (ATP)